MYRPIYVLILCMAIAFGSVGCAKKLLTPEEIAAERQRQLNMITRIYDNTTTEDVLVAVDRIFRLADDDYEISHTPNGVQAMRRWLIYLVISATFGTDTWVITTEALPDNRVKVVAMHSSSDSAILAGSTGNGGAYTVTTPELKNMTTTPAIYQLFYARLDYFLGKNKTWITCKDANKLFTDGSLEPFCMVANDRTPDGKSAAQRSREAEEAN